MTLLPILEIGAPVLRQMAQPLTVDQIRAPETQRFIDDLVETMRHANGAGLAATQVGRLLRICAVEVKANNPRYPYKPQIPLRVLINPEIKVMGEQTFMNYEGCLSVPNLRGMVPRAVHIELNYLDREGRPHQERVSGISAGTYQHEVDHLDGSVFIDRVVDTHTLCTWANFEAEHKKAFVASILKMQRELSVQEPPQ